MFGKEGLIGRAGREEKLLSFVDVWCRRIDMRKNGCSQRLVIITG